MNWRKLKRKKVRHLSRDQCAWMFKVGPHFYLAVSGWHGTISLRCLGRPRSLPTGSAPSSVP